MIYLDDNFPQDARIVAHPLAGWLYVSAIGWLKRASSTDGLIPKAVVPILATVPPDTFEKLVELGWFIDRGDAFEVKNYTVRNAKAIATSEKRRAAARARWERQRCKTDADADANGMQMHVQNESPVHMPQRTSEPVKQTPPRVDERFEAFWAAYPRKVDKGAAKKAWPRAVAKCDGDYGRLVTAATRYAADVRGMEQRFVKHPATWLNAEAWENTVTVDEPMTEADFLNAHHAKIAAGA